VCDGGGENGSEDGPACSTVPGSLPRAQEIYDYFDLDKALKPFVGFLCGRKGTASFLCERILDYVRQEELDFLTGITAFLNSAALYGIKILEEDADERQDAVRLMTLHASKGLEVSVCFHHRRELWADSAAEQKLGGRRGGAEAFLRGAHQGAGLSGAFLVYQSCPAADGAGGEPLSGNDPGEASGQRGSEEKGAADLAELRRAVQEAKGKKQEEERAVDRADNEKKPDRTASPRRVRHERYGTGTVTEEDESKITVEFESYGVKEFLKAFTKLEEAE